MEVQVFDYFNPKHMNRCLHQIEIVTILKTLQLCHSTLIGLFISHVPEGLVSHCFSGYSFHSFCLQPLILLKGKIKIPSLSIFLFLGSQSFTFWLDKHFLVKVLCSSASLHVTIEKIFFYAGSVPWSQSRSENRCVRTSSRKVDCTTERWEQLVP